MASHPDFLDIVVPGLTSQFIGGSWIERNTGVADVISPTTEGVLAQIAEPTLEDANAAVDAARKAFDAGPWPNMAVSERVKVCRRLCDLLEEKMDLLNRAWTFESGPSLAHGAMINGSAGVSIWRQALEVASKLPWEEERDGALIWREPIGTVLGVLTFNGPIVLMGMKIIPALLAGCAVIIKHAPESSLTSRLIAETILEADFPPGVVSVLAAGPEVSQHLVAHSGIDMIALTGGTQIGIDVIKKSADRLARTALELGGKSPAIIDDDADIDKVIETLGPGSTGYMGQVCVNLSRVIAPRHRYNEIVDALADYYNSIQVGDPFDESIDQGPLAAARARDRAEKYVDIAKKEGASIVTGGIRPAHLDRGWFYSPTLLADVTNDMTVAQEEIFGPITAVIAYDGLDHAIRIANDSSFGLACSVYTNDKKTALTVARKIRSGAVAINNAGVSLTQPFGGYKKSGWGRECGPEGILEFTQIKQVTLPPSYLDI